MGWEARDAVVAFILPLSGFWDVADLRLIIGHEIEKKAQDQGSETLALNFINYRGKTLNVPDRFLPDLDFLNYHRYHIFQG